MSTNLNIRVPKQLMADFNKACEANYTTKSEVIRQAMLAYVRGNQKKEDKTMKKWEELAIRSIER